MKKNTIIVTGGAGFVGSNLIDHLIRKTKFKIISIDETSIYAQMVWIYTVSLLHVFAPSINDTFDLLCVACGFKQARKLFLLRLMQRVADQLLTLTPGSRRDGRISAHHDSFDFLADISLVLVVLNYCVIIFR